MMSTHNLTIIIVVVIVIVIIVVIVVIVIVVIMSSLPYHHLRISLILMMSTQKLIAIMKGMDVMIMLRLF